MALLIGAPAISNDLIQEKSSKSVLADKFNLPLVILYIPNRHIVPFIH
jgi:hypothetical protein